LPLLLVSKLQEVKFHTKAELPYKLRDKYPEVFRLIDIGHKVEARVYVNRFYNEEGDVVKEYKHLFVLPLEKYGTSYYADFTYFHVRDGIPVGYFVSNLLINFMTTDNEGGKIEIPVFPSEFLIEKGIGIPDKVSRLVDTERQALEHIGRDVEVVGLLYGAGLHHIATDLVEALERFYMSDYEGAIKFFRKVVEGLRNRAQSGKLGGMSENRQKLLQDYLSKAYQLVSNFGEHSGTYGFMPEAMLSKDAAVSLCRYIVTYLGGG